MDEKSEKNILLISLIAILAPIFYTNASRALGVMESSWMLFILVIVYTGVGIYIWNETFKRTWRYFFVVLILIPIGVFIDVAIDFNLRNIDRNLFPIEIVVLWVTTPIPLLIGMSIKKYKALTNKST